MKVIIEEFAEIIVSALPMILFIGFYMLFIKGELIGVPNLNEFLLNFTDLFLGESL